jgi:hypothetical protein
MNNYAYNFNKLGYSCKNNNDTLISNTKFINQNSDIYTIQYTKMFQYPGQTYDFSKTVGHPSFPEDIKTKNEPFVQPKCCGK